MSGDFWSSTLSNIIGGVVAVGIVTFISLWWRLMKPPMTHTKNISKILVVDDSGKDLSNVCNSLREKERYQFIMAASVKEAQIFLRKEQPKYALIDMALSGEEKSEFDGIQLFKFIYENNLATIPIVVSAHSFEVTKPDFEKQLATVIASNKLESILQQIKNNYIDKLDPSFNSLLAIAEKLDELERSSAQNLNKTYC